MLFKILQKLYHWFNQNLLCNHTWYKWKQVGIPNEPDIIECVYCGYITKNSRLLNKLKADLECGSDDKTMWCYCGKGKPKDYPLPFDFYSYKIWGQDFIGKDDHKYLLDSQKE